MTFALKLCENACFLFIVKKMKSAQNLVWLDMEMSGLNPQEHKELELAMVVTDQNLNIVAQAPVWVCHQEDSVLQAMDSWNQKTHGHSGLVQKVKASTLNEAQIEKQAIAFLENYLPKGISPLCGNTISQDRRFMRRYMPELDAYFHYRNIDISTLKELCKRWQIEIYRGFTKKANHTALQDVLESIEELKYYRAHFLKV